ncbi:hypothetical protein B0H13DRAFT_2577052 [Mycena leptocephala]|nr:hypothetical protein B0H13DRAFT_2577052 [Mycena leptocephala]
MWGFIEISSSKKIAHLDVLLQRSGVAPLNIKITWLDVQIPPSLLLQHSERLRDLDLTGPTVAIREFTALIPNHTFPILRSLKFHPWTWENAPDEPPNAVPDGVFDGRAPCLTILELSYIHINWNRIHGLTTLCLTSVRNTHPPTDGALLSMLEASPALTHLKLSFMVSQIPVPLWSYPIVSLPLLEFFCVEDQSSCCNRLLRHVIVPPRARLSVLGWDIGGRRELVDLLVPLRRHLRDPSAPAVSYLRLECMSTPEMGPVFTVRTSTAVPQADILDEAHSRFLITTHPRSDNLLRQIMAKIFKLFPCASITHLDCRTAMHLTLTSWREALVRLPALETVYIGVNIGATRLLLALLESVEKANGRYPPLRCIHFSTPISTRGGSAGTEPVAPVFAALEDLLGVLFLAGFHSNGSKLTSKAAPLT